METRTEKNQRRADRLGEQHKSPISSEAQAQIEGFGGLWEVAELFGIYCEENSIYLSGGNSPFSKRHNIKQHSVWVGGTKKGLEIGRRLWANRQIQAAMQEIKRRREQHTQLIYAITLGYTLAYLMVLLSK